MSPNSSSVCLIFKNFFLDIFLCPNGQINLSRLLFVRDGQLKGNTFDSFRVSMNPVLVILLVFQTSGIFLKHVTTLYVHIFLPYASLPSSHSSQKQTLPTSFLFLLTTAPGNTPLPSPAPAPPAPDSLRFCVHLSFHHPSFSPLFGPKIEARGGEQHGSRPLPTTPL